MDKYYYFITQLPTLSFAKETTMNIDTFLAEGEKWLNEKDYKLLLRVNKDKFSVHKSDPQILQMYKTFENKLRTDIAHYRETRQKNVEYKPTTFSSSLIKEKNPLEVETLLMEMRWNKIDEMERDHHFDLDYLILYYLKLQLLDRFFLFNKEEGLKKFKTLYEVPNEQKQRENNRN